MLLRTTSNFALMHRSPAASPSPKLRKLQNPLRGSYNEAVHLPVPTPVAARDRRVSQSLEFSRLEASAHLTSIFAMSTPFLF